MNNKLLEFLVPELFERLKEITDIRGDRISLASQRLFDSLRIVALITSILFVIPAAAPDGLGRNTGIPIFARVTRKFGPAARIDLYAGLVANGKLRLLDANGETLRSADYGSAPLLAISGSFSF